MGGSVSYAATTALRMNCQVGIVTSAGPGLDLQSPFPGAQIECLESKATTLFENIYEDGKRTQVLHQRADVITCEQIPLAWRAAPMVYLGTIDQEITPEVFGCFSEDSTICVMPQGFFRRWNEQGLVSFAEWTPAERVLQRIDVLVLSELDVPEPDRLVGEWSELVKIIVVTRAERGATVYMGADSCDYPARPTRQVDPTGAGDVFAAAYLISLHETNDPCAAAGFANAAASFSIEKPGVAGIPFRAEVDAYLAGIG